MSIYRVMAMLLEYPDAVLRDALPDIKKYIEEQSEISAGEKQVIFEFINKLETTDLTESQELYVQTFDLTPEHSMHLTHHLFGEENGRGPALIDLTEYYRSFGFEHAQDELPDYLPLVLEFSSQIEVDEAKMFLSRITKIVTQLAMNLEEAQSIYAPLLRVVEKNTRLLSVAA